MIVKKLKSIVFGIIFSAAAGAVAAPAFAQNLPIFGNVLGGDLLGGGIPVVGGLLGGDLLGGGLPVVGGLLDGGLPLVGSLGDGGLPVVGGLLDGGLSLVGVSLGDGGLPFGIDPSMAANDIFDLVLNIGTDSLSGGGIAAIPLVGTDIAHLLTPDGLIAGLQGLLTDLSLPVGLPVIGRDAVQLLVPVGTTLLNTYGLPVGNGDIPELGLGGVVDVLLLPVGALDILSI